MRRARDAIAGVHQFGTHGYRWVLDADIEAAFDTLSHCAALTCQWWGGVPRLGDHPNIVVKLASPRNLRVMRPPA